MNAQKISTFLRKTGVLASLLAASAAVTGSLAPSASAATLLPPPSFAEGEIDVGLGCLTGACYDPTDFPLIDSIVSLVDTTTGTRSRLFLDVLTTANTYNGGSLGTAIFLAGDEGTTPAGLWFRPSETANNQGRVGEERGRLEVGTYTFTFKNPLSKLLVRYFDTEVGNFTSVLNTDGTLVTDGDFTGPNPVPSGPDGNIQYQTWTNVSTITLKLGRDIPNGTGDGVDFQF
ncbi:MAG TPA: LEVG family PEP-CTERM protein, partial [Coleofasciculaceae cyanobacterium]